MIPMSAGLNLLSATEAAGKIRSGEISSEELVQACLDRIEKREPAVRAWEFLDPELALAQARRCDACRDPESPLHGVPIGIKDQFDTADMPTGYGSPIYEGHRPAADAESVARLRTAGAVILGKTKLTEFALYHSTDTTNPLDAETGKPLAHVPQRGKQDNQGHHGQVLHDEHPNDHAAR